MQITIDTTEHENNALFLRQAIASGTADDGTEVEVSTTGVALVLQYQKPGEDRIVHTVQITDVLQVWAAAIAVETEGGK